MVQKSIKELPKKFSDLRIPDEEGVLSKQMEAILFCIGKTPEIILRRFREDSLKLENYYCSEETKKCYFRKDIIKAEYEEHVEVSLNPRIPKLTIEYGSIVHPFLEQYVDYNLVNHLRSLFFRVNRLTCGAAYYIDNSGVFRMMREFFLDHYEEADGVNVDLDKVQEYLSKILEENSCSEEYERAMKFDKDGEPFYRRHKHDLDFKFLDFMSRLHDDEYFIDVVKNALYIEKTAS